METEFRTLLTIIQEVNSTVTGAMERDTKEQEIDLEYLMQRQKQLRAACENLAQTTGMSKFQIDAVLSAVRQRYEIAFILSEAFKKIKDFSK